jgi:hypothetical protein
MRQRLFYAIVLSAIVFVLCFTMIPELFAVGIVIVFPALYAWDSFIVMIDNQKAKNEQNDVNNKEY